MAAKRKLLTAVAMVIAVGRLEGAELLMKEEDRILSLFEQQQGSAWQEGYVTIVEKPIQVNDLPSPYQPSMLWCEHPLPKVHMNKPRKIILKSFYEYDRFFYHEVYLKNLAPHTVNQQQLLSQSIRGPHNQLFTTLTESPNFILWGKTPNGMAGFDMSAFDDKKVVVGEYVLDNFPRTYVDPATKKFSRLRQTITLKNGPIPYVAFISNNIGTFAHFILDHLGYWAYFRRVFPSNARFIFADYKHQNRARIELLDPTFAKRIDWIDCNNEKQCSTLVRIRQGGTLTVLTSDEIHGRHMTMLDLARQWINEVYPRQKPDPQPTVIYYTRNSPNASHDRKLDLDLEERVLKHIRKALLDRPEKLVVFDGTEPFADQIALFRSATTVIGPHGGGMANLFWMAPNGTTCQERPRVLEFLISPQTRNVQRGYLGKTYFKLYSTAPWVEFHHIFYVPPSNHETVFIDLADLDVALHALFGSSANDLHKGYYAGEEQGDLI